MAFAFKCEAQGGPNAAPSVALLVSGARTLSRGTRPAAPPAVVHQRQKPSSCLFLLREARRNKRDSWPWQCSINKAVSWNIYMLHRVRWQGRACYPFAGAVTPFCQHTTIKKQKRRITCIQRNTKILGGIPKMQNEIIYPRIKTSIVSVNRSRWHVQGVGNTEGGGGQAKLGGEEPQ